MTYIHHRVTLTKLPEDWSKKYADWLCSQGYKSVIVFERTNMVGFPTKPHLHVCIHASVGDAHYIKKFREHFPEVKGQPMHGAHIIINELDNDKYIFKGLKDKEPTILYNSGYSEDYINQCHIDFWKSNAIKQSNLTPSIVPTEQLHNEQSDVVLEGRPPRKSKPLTWIQRIPQLCIESYPDWKWDSSVRSKARIYKIVIKNMGSATRIISGRRIRDICDGVQNTLAPEDTENEFWSKAYPDVEFVPPGFFRDF